MKPADLLSSQALADEFTRLRRELEAREPRPAHVAVLGADPGGGVSTVAAQLALSLAVGGEPGSVLLVDAHLRGGAGHEPSPLAGTGPGLWQWDLRSALPAQPLERQPALHVLGSGSAPADRLGLAPVSERLLAALHQARERYHWSVWDLPPVLEHGDGLDLAAACDGALIVIEMDQTRVDALRYLRQALERRHATVVGSVLNRCGRWWPRSTRRLAG